MSSLSPAIEFIDPFAGIGGFRLGLESVGYIQSTNEKRQNNRNFKTKFHKRKSRRIFSCVWSNEWDKYARQIYKKHFGECDGRDIREVPTDDIPKHDLLCAGWPCQSFSVAGKRRGFEDTRGTLFFEICRILKDKRPSHLLLENVKGLLSHQDGWTFATILLSLDELGYDVEWQVLNSKHFGVPQNRERVFIVGHLRGESRPEIFPIRKNHSQGKQKNSNGVVQTQDIAGCVKEGMGRRLGLDGSITFVANCLDANYGKGWLDHGQRTMVAITDSGLHRQKQIRTDILPPLRAGRGCDRQDTVQLFNGQTIRRLTPVECERLQGFPDGWTEGVSDTQRYKMLGNAVTVNVVETIGRRLAEAILEEA